MPLTRRQLAAIFAKMQNRERAKEDGKGRIATGRVPSIIKRVGFDFDWDEKKVWALKGIPTTKMPISELSWHFDIPFLTHKGEDYQLAPKKLLQSPNIDPTEYRRMMQADLRYPIDLMENKGRWLILDGLHRLMKARMQGAEEVRVRVIPRERIPEILED